MHAAICDLFLPGGSHTFLQGVAALWIFSAAVGALNPPDEKSSQRYLWLYRFAHLLAANLDRAGLLNGLPAEQAEEPSAK